MRQCLWYFNNVEKCYSGNIDDGSSLHGNMLTSCSNNLTVQPTLLDVNISPSHSFNHNLSVTPPAINLPLPSAPTEEIISSNLISEDTATSNDNADYVDQCFMDFQDLNDSEQLKHSEMDVLEEPLDISTGMEIPLDNLILPDRNLQKDLDDSDVLEDMYIENMTTIISTPKDTVIDLTRISPPKDASITQKDEIRNLDFR